LRLLRGKPERFRQGLPILLLLRGLTVLAWRSWR
jgi:hypothetical protein